MNKAILNKIIRFSNVDGPGNRMAIFFQGCNFNCRYCHNPETINICNNCGSCLKVCPTGALFSSEKSISWYEKKCVECDRCIKICPYSASPKVKEITVDYLINEIDKVKYFIKGITVSGGESSLRYDFLTELFREVKKVYPHLTCFVDTNGGLDFQDKKLKDFIEITDSFMLDIKAWNDDEHIFLTNFTNKSVVENLHFLKNLGKLFEVRTVVVPELLNNEEIVKNVSKIISGSNIRYKLIKYRKYGVRELYQNQLSTPPTEYMNKLKNLALKYGVRELVII